tara:strand:- start:305 stop:1150 length:846 start_codon:yes stop_codon:yes gene_type:complete
MFIIRNVLKVLSNNCTFYQTKQHTVPKLTLAHKERRLSWATELLSKQSKYGEGTNICHIHIDEKWFRLFLLKRRIYLPQGVKKEEGHARQVAGSKAHIPKVMFLAAVGFPRADKGFCGSIGIWPVTQKKVAKAISIYHKKGDIYEESVTMDGKVFIEMMKEKVFPTAVAKVGMWAEKIIFQMDSAGSVLSFFFFLVFVALFQFPKVFVEFPIVACVCQSFLFRPKTIFSSPPFLSLFVIILLFPLLVVVFLSIVDLTKQYVVAILSSYPLIQSLIFINAAV